MKSLSKYLILAMWLGNFCTASSQTFTQTAVTGIGLAQSKAGGAVWADFDNDGDLDLLVNTDQNNATGRTRLLRSDGAANPSFTDVTTTYADGLLDNTLERSILWGDFNNDGNMDFIRNTYNRMEIYINRGTSSTPNYMFGVGAGMTPNITFTQLSVDGCSRGDGMNVEGVAILDYDNDGWLDIVIENGECGIDILENQQLSAGLINTTIGDGNMSTVAEATTNTFMQHVSITGNTLGLPLTGENGDFMGSGDFDVDGYVDFIVRKPSDATFGHKLYENDGDGTFSTNSTIPPNNAATAAANANKGGVIFCDFDLDGDLDVYWTDAGTNQIWLQTTTGNFVASAKPTIPGTPDIDGCACADVDGDGDIDLFLGNNAGNSYLYINTTSGINSIANLSFTRTDLAVNANAEGVNLVDYDDDGDYDIYVNVDNAANQLWENDLCDGGGCDFLKVFTQDCVDGTSSTRPIVGASMIIKDDMGNIVSGAQTGSTAAGHGAQNPPSTIFYLPDMTSDYTIDITFPEKNGTIETYSYDFNAGDIVNNELTLTALNGTDGSSCDSFSTLPVELTSFKATPNASNIRLDWKTATELNNDRFEIQRSADGYTFEVIGNRLGNGTSTEKHSYSFIDNSPLIGANYYRLNQVDFDGKNEIHKTIVEFFEAEDDLTVYPNPASDRINIYLGKRFSRTEVEIKLIDISGKTVWTKEMRTPEVSIDAGFNNLENGVYFLNISNSNYSTSRRISIEN